MLYLQREIEIESIITTIMATFEICTVQPTKVQDFFAHFPKDFQNFVCTNSIF